MNIIIILQLITITIDENDNDYDNNNNNIMIMIMSREDEEETYFTTEQIQHYIEAARQIIPGKPNYNFLNTSS